MAAYLDFTDASYQIPNPPAVSVEDLLPLLDVLDVVHVEHVVGCVVDGGTKWTDRYS